MNKSLLLILSLLPTVVNAEVTTFTSGEVLTAGALNNNFENVNGAMASLKADTSSISDTVATLKVGITELETKISSDNIAVGASITTVTESLTTVSGDVAILTSDIESLNSTVTDNLTAVSGDMASLTSDIGSLNSVVVDLSNKVNGPVLEERKIYNDNVAIGVTTDNLEGEFSTVTLKLYEYNQSVITLRHDGYHTGTNEWEVKESSLYYPSDDCSGDNAYMVINEDPSTSWTGEYSKTLIFSRTQYFDIDTSTKFGFDYNNTYFSKRAVGVNEGQCFRMPNASRNNMVYYKLTPLSPSEASALVPVFNKYGITIEGISSLPLANTLPAAY